MGQAEERVKPAEDTRDGVGLCPAPCGEGLLPPEAQDRQPRGQRHGLTSAGFLGAR